MKILNTIFFFIEFVFIRVQQYIVSYEIQNVPNIILRHKSYI